MLRNTVSGPEISLPGRLWPDCYKESTEISPPAGGPIFGFPESNPAKFQLGRPIYGPEAPLRNIEQGWESMDVTMPFEYIIHIMLWVLSPRNPFAGHGRCQSM